MYVNAQTRVNLLAGADRMSLSASNNGVGVSLGEDWGFHLGAGLEFKLASNLYIDAQGTYMYVMDKAAGLSEKVHSLNVPIRLKVKGDISENVAVYIYGGPMATAGISSKISDGTHSVSFYDIGGKRFDLKAGIGGGLEFNHKFAINVGYDWGLLNQVDSEIVCRFNVLQFGISVFIN